jgi:hypothetical protein
MPVPVNPEIFESTLAKITFGDWVEVMEVVS